MYKLMTSKMRNIFNIKNFKDTFFFTLNSTEKALQLQF